MKVGTKTLLCGTHQVILHPVLMLVAFIKVHRRCPSMAEFLAIWLHDIGYWGRAGLDIKGGEEHPYAGAKLMEKLFGKHGRDLVLGHSSCTCAKEGIEKSSLYLPDKHYFLLLPPRLHWLLAILSGECEEYKNTEIGFDPWAFREHLKKKLLDDQIQGGKG